MPNHEIKTCPRCKESFECKLGNISHCQCNGLQLSSESMHAIATKYQDCLCRNCLLEIMARNSLISASQMQNR
ncbi:MAG: cysteine-rich CWC family protein [Chitinophagales bacterium]